MEPSEAASVSSVEVALCNVSELVMLGIAAAASEPHMFGLLVNLSAGAVAAAALVFSIWVLSGRAATVSDGILVPSARAS